MLLPNVQAVSADASPSECFAELPEIYHIIAGPML